MLSSELPSEGRGSGAGSLDHFVLFSSCVECSSYGFLKRRSGLNTMKGAL